MKRLILAGVLAFGGINTANAQDAASADAQVPVKQDIKQLFGSRINELKSYSSRNATEHLARSMKQLMEMMKTEINTSKGRLTSAAIDQKASVRKVYDRQSQLYAEIKPLATNVSGNLSQLQEKLLEFYETL